MKDAFENHLEEGVLVLVYVDDLLIVARDEKEGADFLQKLMRIWKIKPIPGENHPPRKGWGVFSKFGGE